MANPDNARILGEEQAITQQEAALLAQEQGLWQRSSVAGRWDATVPQRVQGLLTRVASLEQAGFQSNDFPKARAVLQAILSDEPALATGERGAALPVRRAAMQARETALHALAQAITQLETLRSAQRRDLEAIDSFVQGAERTASQHAERAAAEKQAADRITAERAAVARVEQERVTAERTAARAAELKRAAEASAPPPVGAPAPTLVLPTGVPAARNAPAVTVPTPAPIAKAAAPAPIAPAPVAKAAAPAPVAKAAAPAPVAKAAAVSPKAAPPHSRKLSRRRRIRRAPPPKKMDVDVAVWGENTFYTGFDSKISSGGLFVSSLETLPAGHELDLAIALEGRRIQTRGRVEFTRADNTANPECTQGAGIRLLNLQPDATSVIEAFFHKRPPLFMIARS